MKAWEWVKCVREASEQLENLEFLQEGATHLAKVLEERDQLAADVARLREDLAKAESFAESMRQNRDEVLRSSQQDANDAARLKLVVHNVYAAIGNEVSR